MIDSEKISKIKEKTSAVKTDIHQRTVGYILTALGLVAGLAWNDAISSGIKYFFPLDQNGILPKFIYAIVVTFAIVLVSNSLLKLTSREEK